MKPAFVICGLNKTQKHVLWRDQINTTKWTNKHLYKKIDDSLWLRCFITVPLRSLFMKPTMSSFHFLYRFFFIFLSRNRESSNVCKLNYFLRSIAVPVYRGTEGIDFTNAIFLFVNLELGNFYTDCKNFFHSNVYTRMIPARLHINFEEIWFWVPETHFGRCLLKFYCVLIIF